MNKNMQIIISVFVVLVSGVVIYFMNQVIQNQNALEQKLSDFETKITGLEGGLNIVKDMGATMGKGEISPDLQKFKSNKIKLKMIEGFYCNSPSSGELSILDFVGGSVLKVFQIEQEDEDDNPLDQQQRERKPQRIDRTARANINGNYLIYSPYIYISFIEGQTTLNNRFTVLKVDERGYVRQLGLAQEVFANELCPVWVKNSY